MHLIDAYEQAPCKPITVDELSSKANVLSVSLAQLQAENESESSIRLISTDADRRVNIFDPIDLTCTKWSLPLQESPILSTQVLFDKYILTASMSGALTIHDHTGKVIAFRKDHTKYIVKTALYEDHSREIATIATAGWDAKVHFYTITSANPGLDVPFPYNFSPYESRNDCVYPRPRLEKSRRGSVTK